MDVIARTRDHKTKSTTKKVKMRKIRKKELYGGARRMILLNKKVADRFPQAAVPVMEPGGCRTHNGAHSYG